MTMKCTVKTRVEYRSAPIAVLEDKSLSAEAKVLLTWLFMHSNGWQFVISYALSKCGISEATWQRRVRKELINAGYFSQSQTSILIDGKQKFAWENEITDEPLYNSSQAEKEAA